MNSQGEYMYIHIFFWCSKYLKRKGKTGRVEPKKRRGEDITKERQNAGQCLGTATEYESKESEMAWKGTLSNSAFICSNEDSGRT